MIKATPKGDGYVMLDAAYFAYENGSLIVKSGRLLVICSKKNCKKKGFNARANMPDWFENDKDGFRKVYHRRSLAESLFSSMNSRTSGRVRARSLKGIQTSLMLRRVCYNLIV